MTVVGSRLPVAGGRWTVDGRRKEEGTEGLRGGMWKSGNQERRAAILPARVELGFRETISVNQCVSVVPFFGAAFPECVNH